MVTPGKLQERLNFQVPFEEDTLARDFGVSDENGNSSSEATGEAEIEMEAGAEAGALTSPAPATGCGLPDAGCTWTSSKENLGSAPVSTIGCAVQVAHSASGASVEPKTLKPPAATAAGAPSGAATTSATSFKKSRANSATATGDRRHSHSSRRGSRPAHRKRTQSHDSQHAVEEEGDDEHGHSHKVFCVCSFASARSVYVACPYRFLFSSLCGVMTI